MNFQSYPPVRSDRQAGTQTPVKSRNIPRCWADHAGCTPSGAALECQALGTGRLGLCPKHEEELFGD